MECKEAAALFENSTQKSVVQIKRCGTGIGNYVFIVSTADERLVLRCSQEKDAYKDTVYWLSRLSVCGIPVPAVLSEGRYGDYSYLILSYIPGDDLGTVYDGLSECEKKQIAKEVAAIQRKAAGLAVAADPKWTWRRVLDELLCRAEERIQRKNYFDAGKIYLIRNLQQEIQEYLDQVQPVPYLDDISTKNLLIDRGKLSGIIDIDWMGLGDALTFAALTRVSLLNQGSDTRYIDYLLNEMRPTPMEYRAFVFYCLIFCVDFMGERGMQFLDKTVPVSRRIIGRLNDIFDLLLEEWNQCSRQ